MWHKDDTINLNGSLSFYSEKQSIEVRDDFKRLFALDLDPERCIDQETGRPVWVLNFSHSNQDPCIKNILRSLAFSKEVFGTLTYIFNHRLEAGIFKNGDLIIYEPKDLIFFAAEKMNIEKEKISPSDYDKIKQSWFFYVWQV